MKKYLLIPLLVLLFSCQGDAIEKEHKGDFEVEFLFEKDGCKVYRFWDGKYVYYTDCKGNSYEQHRSGKTTATNQTLNSGR